MSVIIHASCVALQGRGILIIGPSGSGKSGLSLALIALGASLIADDRTLITKRGAHLFASSAPNIGGFIEARGIGILRLPHENDVQLQVVIDMGQEETERLPAQHLWEMLTISLPCIHRSNSPYFPAGIFAYLNADRLAD